MTDFQTYDDVTYENWRAELEKHDHHNRRHLLTLFGLMGTPSTMLDIGCGTGKMVWTARQLGVEAYGVDQLCGPDRDYDSGWFFHHDLRHVFSLSEHGKPGVVNLVLCLEVAEHIAEEYTDNFLNTVCSHLDREENSYLVFSSALPGQGGIAHETERPARFWRDEFHQRGVNHQNELTLQLKLLWSHINSPLEWLPANVQVFKR